MHVDAPLAAEVVCYDAVRVGQQNLRISSMCMEGTYAEAVHPDQLGRITQFLCKSLRARERRNGIVLEFKASHLKPDK